MSTHFNCKFLLAGKDHSSFVGREEGNEGGTMEERKNTSIVETIWKEGKGRSFSGGLSPSGSGGPEAPCRRTETAFQ